MIKVGNYEFSISDGELYFLVRERRSSEVLSNGKAKWGDLIDLDTYPVEVDGDELELLVDSFANIPYRCRSFTRTPIKTKYTGDFAKMIIHWMDEFIKIDYFPFPHIRVGE